MPVSRYPRRGRRLAPALLSDLLQEPVPGKLIGWATKERVRFADLDETAWARFDVTCHALADALVQQVQRCVSPASAAVADRRLPRLPEHIRIEDLELETRTRNCLEMMQVEGILEDALDLGGMTIGELLAFRGFGAKCLVDLITSVESVVSGLHAVTSPEEVQGPRPSATEGHGGANLVASAPPLSPAGRVATEADGQGGVGSASGRSMGLSVFAARNLRLPKLPNNFDLGRLGLRNRTYNCLRRQGLDKRPRDLEKYTVGELLELPGFGVQCLTDLLQALNCSLNQAAVAPDMPPERPPSQAACLPEARTLEEELHFLLARGCQVSKPSPMDRNLQIAARYLGLDGGCGATLQEIGAGFGLTRERVRQICQRAEKGLKGCTGPAPLLDRALSTVKQLLPSPADLVEAKLREAGITQASFRLEALDRAARLLGRAAPFVVETIDDKRMAVQPGGGQMARHVVVIARRAISRYGVATTSEVAATVQERTSRPATAEIIASIMDGRPGFEWLDKETGWFFLRLTRRNRVISRIRKILSIAEKIHVTELRSGIARHHAMKGYAPPRRVLLELCRRLPNCRVEGEIIRAQGENDWKKVLRGAEFTMAQVLMENGPVMQRARFEAMCFERGMKRSTFWVYLDYSPVIERFAPGVYGLRGAAVEPGALETLISRNTRRAPARLDHGWTADRKLWVGYRLSEAMLTSGVFSVPSGLKSFLQGSFVLKVADGIKVGTAVVKGATGWGMGPFFRCRGGEPGDTLVLVFDSKAREALVSIGGDELLEEQQLTPARPEEQP